MSERTTLSFEARIHGIKPKTGTVPTYSKTGMPEGGELEVTLKIEQPKAPRSPEPPTIPYTWDQGGKWKPRPADLKRKADESDEDYDARPAVVARRAEQQSYDSSHATWEAKQADYEEARREFQPLLEEHMQRVGAYAALVGLSATLGGLPLTVTITPSDAAMLPGFGVSLLGPGQ